MAKSGRGLVVPRSSGRRNGEAVVVVVGKGGKKVWGNRSRGGNGGGVGRGLWVGSRAGDEQVGLDPGACEGGSLGARAEGWGARSGMRARDMPCVRPLKWPWTVSVLTHEIWRAPSTLSVLLKRTL